MKIFAYVLLILLTCFIYTVSVGLVYFIIREKEGRRNEGICNGIPIGSSEKEIIRQLGTPKKVIYFYSERDKVDYKVLHYQTSILASSPVDFFINPKTNTLVYRSCGGD